MSLIQTIRRPDVMFVTLAAAGILAITMGARQSLGLFVSPLNGATGLGIASISLAMAIGQFSWGAIQPIAGAVADRFGPRPVLLAGLVLLALGTALTPFMSTQWGLILSIGVMSAIGSGAGSFSVLIGAAAQRLPADARGAASGVINAGGSFGQFVFAPVLQKLIQWLGWMNAMWAMAFITLAALPMVGLLTRRDTAAPAQAGPTATAATVSATAATPAPADAGVMQAMRDALSNPSYLLLHAGFFTCGFHIAFLVTHLPGEVDLCGLPPAVASWSLAIIGLANIVGSLYAGSWVARYRSKMVLAAMYASRALLVGLYLLAPKTEWTFYLFAAGLGFTWLATVPPTAALVSKLFGVRYLGTLFGLTLFSHQIGGFLGAWLGGLTITTYGNYDWMWYADIMLAAAAALLNLPIREARIERVAVSAA
jgi:MFS family permease